MVSAILLLCHIIAAVFLFLKYKRISISDGILSVTLMIIIFSVGWTITTMITNLIFSIECITKWYYRPPQSLFIMILQREFNRDTISLLLLTITEVIAYFLFFSEKSSKQNFNERQSKM